jgi:hypothetical protein
VDRGEKQEQTWLRWCDKSGKMILMGGERAEKERVEKEQALTQVKQLMAKLQVLGISPDEIDQT